MKNENGNPICTVRGCRQQPTHEAQYVHSTPGGSVYRETWYACAEHATEGHAPTRRHFRFPPDSGPVADRTASRARRPRRPERLSPWAA